MFSEAEAFDALGVEPETPPETPQGGAEAGQEDEAQAGEISQAPEGQAGQEAPAVGQETGDGQTAPQAEGQAEQDAQNARNQAVERAVAKAIRAERDRQQEQMKTFFQKAGLKNTITGEDISSMEDFETWERAYQAQRLQQELAEGRLSPEGLEQAIANSPAVRRAGELVRREEEQAREQQRAEFEVKVREELAEIRQIDPSVNSVEDILQRPGGEQFYGYVKRGLSYLDAFRLTHMDLLKQQAGETAQKAAQQAAQAARTQAQELARSKDHLTGAGTVQGQGAAPVPPAEMALFRDLMPDASESEIQNYYNKYERSLGK